LSSRRGGWDTRSRPNQQTFVNDVALVPPRVNVGRIHALARDVALWGRLMMAPSPATNEKLETVGYAPAAAADSRVGC
jgi:hypothetical protein